MSQEEEIVRKVPSDEDASRLVETVGDLENLISSPGIEEALSQQSAYLESERFTPHVNLQKAAKRQRINNFARDKILGSLEKPEREIKNEDLPEIITLGGVSQTEKNWESRLNAYQKAGVRCRYIELPPFDEGMTFEKQADALYEQTTSHGSEEIAIEAHSWGGLVGWHLMYKYPEIVDHAIISGSPTRSNNDKYPHRLVHLMKWSLQNTEQAEVLIQRLPIFRFFKNMGKGNWPSALRVYLGHIGENGQSQWDKIIKETSEAIPIFLLYGGMDFFVNNIVGRGAADYAKGAVVAVNPIGQHDPIGDDEIALEVHRRLHAQTLKGMKD